jgi:hypothetical protein
MARNIFEERERGYETDYFHKQDEKLLQKMRERAALQEVAEALAEKLRVDDPELLRRVAELGLTRETGAAILLAPLVQVAWAEGTVTDRERAVVFEVAARRGIEPGSPPRAQLEAWLTQRPPDALFDASLEVIDAGLAILTPDERDQRRREIVAACSRVAEASGGGLGRLLGIQGAGTSGQEAAVLAAISAKLRAGTTSA